MFLTSLSNTVVSQPGTANHDTNFTEGEQANMVTFYKASFIHFNRLLIALK